jgi:beta-glucosidase
MIGTNNSHFNSPQQIADGVIAICQRLRTDLPNTKILLLGIFPRTDLPKTNVAQINQEATALFSQIADNKHIFFMNINQKFVGPDGVLRTDLFPDKLHPNEEGYIIWANAIEPEVKKLMGEK